MLLEIKNTICTQVGHFKTEIVRASRAFIPGPVPKLLRESAYTLGLWGVIGPPGLSSIGVYDTYDLWLLFLTYW